MTGQITGFDGHELGQTLEMVKDVSTWSAVHGPKELDMNLATVQQQQDNFFYVNCL